MPKLSVLTLLRFTCFDLRCVCQTRLVRTVDKQLLTPHLYQDASWHAQSDACSLAGQIVNAPQRDLPNTQLTLDGELSLTSHNYLLSRASCGEVPAHS